RSPFVFWSADAGIEAHRDGRVVAGVDGHRHRSRPRQQEGGPQHVPPGPTATWKRPSDPLRTVVTIRPEAASSTVKPAAVGLSGRDASARTTGHLPTATVTPVIPVAESGAPACPPPAGGRRVPLLTLYAGEGTPPYSAASASRSTSS